MEVSASALTTFTQQTLERDEWSTLRLGFCENQLSPLSLFRILLLWMATFFPGKQESP